MNVLYRDTPDGVFQGTVLLQLVEPAKMKLELFPGKTAEEVSEFSSEALIYEDNFVLDKFGKVRHY